MQRDRWIFVDNGPSAERLRATVGGKGASLTRLRSIGMTVPTYFAITTHACADALRFAGLYEPGNAILRKLGQRSPEHLEDLASDWRAAVQAMELPSAMKDDIEEAHATCFGPFVHTAVRSSAAHEDDRDRAFAGMYDTVIDVKNAADVISAVKRVWASCLHKRVLQYVAQRPTPLDVGAMAVLVQQMITAKSSGVMFTQDPVTGAADTAVISVCEGNGQQLVGGQVSGDTIVLKKPRFRPPSSASQASAGTSGWLPPHSPPTAVGECPVSNTPLTDRQLEQVIAVGQQLETQFGCAQDVEFCFDDQSRLYILQSRAVTTRPNGIDRREQVAIWDNSNIIESYSGVTLPMTFSFIRRAYAIVYHCFAQVMGISPHTVHEHRDAFENMLGLFRGRVYYNIKNWYRLVSLFPGYAYNRQFMEAMMGVKESLKDDSPNEVIGFGQRWFVEFPALVGLITRSLWNFARIDQTVRRFETRFDHHYASWSTLDFNQMSPHEIMSNYQMMESAMLWHWRAPIINDFYVMVFYGILRKLCSQWCQDDTGTLQNGLLSGIGNVESAEPARWILQLSEIANSDPRLRTLILEQPADRLPEAIQSDPQFASFSKRLAEFLERYGLRCVDELKLESRSYRDDPQQVYRMIQNYLRRSRHTAVDISTDGESQRSVRETTTQQVNDRLSGQRFAWFRKQIFRSVLHKTRRGVRNRENMRFARTRIYGILRSMLRALGSQFQRAAILREADDIFYLTLDEVWDFIKGTAVTTELSELVRVRKHEYASFASDDRLRPSDRFETRGVAYYRNTFQGKGRTASNAQPQRRLQGIGCCPGVVTGRVQFVRSPAEVTQFVGDILVAERTDPGWVSLYPAFAGLLVERGSVLSHSAIVAREFGIPTIVAVTGLTQELRTGQLVRFDGKTGTIELLPEPDLATHACDADPLSDVRP